MNAKYRELLKEYTYSIPIIYSHIEEQYKYEVVFNDEENYGILFTTFDYHYVFGNIPHDKETFIKYLKEYIITNDKDELIVYGPNKEWEKFLSKIFKIINGTCERRFLYYLNEPKFREYDTTNEFVKLEKIDDPKSRISYPQASIYINGKLISYCRAFMLGKGNAELDVWTDERLRQKGFGFDTSLCLIEHLLDNDIIPNWSCWEERENSHILAKKLGYEIDQKIHAYIWVKDFGKF